MESSKKILLTTIGIALLVVIASGMTFAFFNYTRTGVANNISTGRIYFNTSQNGTISMTNVFPIASSEVEDYDLDEIEIRIQGDTTYANGEEFEISLVDVNNTIVSGSTEKTIPINYIATYTVTPIASGEDPNNIGTSSDSYFSDRGSSSTVYQLNTTGEVSEGEQVLISYIPANVAVDGTLTIKAYIDSSKVAVTDTYPSGNVTHMEGSTEVVDYTNGTTAEWVGDRIVLTTSEWNSLKNSPVSFKIKAESNEGIWVEEPLTGTMMVQRAIEAKQNAQTNSCNPIWVDDMGTSDTSDDITYFSGTNTCVDMNYVWYSGKLWRITAIYPDGAMKLVTQNNITAISFNASGQVNFENSYMYQWLNEDFYDTLYHASEFIDTTKRWNATNSNASSTSAISTRLPETTKVSANVGLLNSYEYYNSYRCVGSSTCTGTSTSYRTGYLNIEYYWWLLNPYSSSNIWAVTGSGDNDNRTPVVANVVRPSIYLKSGLEFVGSGTSANPYKIVGDKDTGKQNDLINTRMSGEYIKLVNNENEQIFRIIGIEDNKTKIIAMDYAENKNTRIFATSNSDTMWGSGTTTDTDTWYTYLNDNSSGYLKNLKSTYGELFDSGLYYLGTSGHNYKLSVCANTTSGSTKVCDKTTDTGTFNIGLPRYGEMFATQQGTGHSNSIYMWLMNRYGSSGVWVATLNGSVSYMIPTGAYGVRPTVHLKSSIKIISGTGTETDPYVVGL